MNDGNWSELIYHNGKVDGQIELIKRIEKIADHDSVHSYRNLGDLIILEGDWIALKKEIIEKNNGAVKISTNTKNTKNF